MTALADGFSSLFDASVANAGSFLSMYLPFVGILVGLAFAGFALGFVVRYFRAD